MDKFYVWRNAEGYTFYDVWSFNRFATLVQICDTEAEADALCKSLNGEV